MKVVRPSEDDVRKIANDAGLGMDPDFGAFWNFIQSTFDSYDILDDMQEEQDANQAATREVRNSRKPRPDENRFGGWAWLCDIRIRKEGRLSQKRIAIKDSIPVAGIPMSSGSRLLAGFVPHMDATVVSRILDAGGTIMGKSMCEDLCVSGGSDTSNPWPVRNPWNPEYMAGGSSSGSAALIACGDVEMAMGGDQAGSIRIPSSWCGVYGLKPTWGLVPYTGAFPIEFGIDHLGPMANSIENLALLLQTVAGRDGTDARQFNTPTELPEYSQDLRGQVEGLSIAILEEGFNWEGVSEVDVDERVESCAWSFEKLGAKVDRVSIPMHRRGVHIWSGIAIEGAWSTMIRDNGSIRGPPGMYDPVLVEYFGKARREKPEFIANTLRAMIVMSEFLEEKYFGKFYAIAQNLRRRLRAAYDNAFEKYDVLLLPTTVLKAPRLRVNDAKYSFEIAMKTLLNTCPFDVTGHPALSLPCGFSNNLPVGMMLVGRDFAESILLNVAKAFTRLENL